MMSEKKSRINNNAAASKRQFFARRIGKNLSTTKKAAFENCFPAYRIPKEILKEDGAISSAHLFSLSSSPSPLILEIGFGSGEHLAGLLKKNPECYYIGVEPFQNGMASLLQTLEASPAENLRLFDDDAFFLVRSLESQCLDKIYILNPDPWPKKRHHKRRIVKHENLDDLARILKPGGQLIMTTDVDELAAWMAMQTATHPAFEWTAQSKADWQTMPADWIETRYEQKGKAAGRSQSYLIFKRKA